MSRKSCLIVALVVVVVLILATLTLGNMVGGSMADRASPATASADRDNEGLGDGNATDNAADAIENAGDAIDNAVVNMDADIPLAAGEEDTQTSPDQAEHGVGAFVQPDDMEVDNWYTVEFVAAPDKGGLTEESEGLELTQARAIYVAPIMRVTLLEDPNFEIRPKTPAVQMTGRDKAASWQWNVKPLTGGSRVLHAKVEVLRRLPDGSLDATDSYTRRVAVQVKVGTWKGFLAALKNATSLGEVLGTLFAAWEKTLLALAALITATSAVWLAIRKWGKPSQ